MQLVTNLSDYKTGCAFEFKATTFLPQKFATKTWQYHNLSNASGRNFLFELLSGENEIQCNGNGNLQCVVEKLYATHESVETMCI